MKIKSYLENIPLYLVCFVLATVPLLFGAVHPVVSAFYTFLILVCLGGWLCFFVPGQKSGLISKYWLMPILVLFGFATLQSVPLPLSWMEIVSPERAGRIQMLNELAHTQIQFVTISEHGFLSLTTVALLIALLIYYVSLKLLIRRDEKTVKRIVYIIIAVGLVEALYGIFQFLSPRLGVLWLPRKYHAACGSIIYKNQYASFLNMCWPIALAVAASFLAGAQHLFNKRTLGLRERIKRMGDNERLIPIFFLASGIMLLAVLFSLSRGGMISMLLVMLILNVLLPISRKMKIVFFVLFCAFLTAYGSFLGLDTLVARFDNIDAAGSSRIQIYLSSLPLLLDHWLTGVGLGSYSLLSPVYLKGIASTAHFDKAHNEYLQLLIEFGIPAGMLLLTWLFAGMMLSGKILFQNIQKQETDADFSIVIGGAAFCGLLGFFFHGIADFGWRLPANLFYAVTLAALVSHAVVKIRNQQSTAGRGRKRK